MDLDVAARTHRELILGLTKLFELLVKMRYISQKHVSYPPHKSPPVDVERLRRLGFDDDAIAAAQVMPQLRHEIVWGWQAEGVELAPNSKALNFLAITGNAHELQDDVREGRFSYLEGAGQLPPWVLRLTNGAPANFGVHMLLDARQGDNQPSQPPFPQLFDDSVFELTVSTKEPSHSTEFQPTRGVLPRIGRQCPPAPVAPHYLV